MSWKTAVAVGALRGCAWLPLPLLHAAGYGAGVLLWLIPNNQRRIAAVNLKVCLPELSAPARRRLLRRCLIETSKAVLEMGPLWLWNGRRTLRLVHGVENEAAWHQALQERRGAIAITPHLGSWEMAGLYLSSRTPLTILYRPSRLGDAVDRLICQGRGRLGARLVPTTSQGVRRLLRALNSGTALGILPDQDPGPNGGVYAPFFGQPANTMVLLSRLASKHCTPVFLLYAERLRRGRGYRLHFERLPDKVSQAASPEAAAALNQAIEQAIRRCPEQYLWSYKRFKRPPPDRPSLY